MATTHQHIAAREDQDLRDRLFAAAEQAGIPSPQEWVDRKLGALLTAQVAGDQTIVDAHAYADSVRKEYLADERALPPGINPGAVADAHLAAAIAAVLQPPAPEV